MRLKKINGFRRTIKKNQNKNFFKKINHEYFGGFDVTNVSQVHILKLKSPFMILQIKIKLIFMLVIIETAYLR